MPFTAGFSGSPASPSLVAHTGEQDDLTSPVPAEWEARLRMASALVELNQLLPSLASGRWATPAGDPFPSPNRGDA